MQKPVELCVTTGPITKSRLRRCLPGRTGFFYGQKNSGLIFKQNTYGVSSFSIGELTFSFVLFSTFYTVHSFC